MVDASLKLRHEMFPARQADVAKAPRMLRRLTKALRNRHVNNDRNSIREVRLCCELPKLLATVGEVAEPVVTGTPRREQHDIARRRLPTSKRNRFRQRRTNPNRERCRGVIEQRLQPCRRSTDQRDRLRSCRGDFDEVREIHTFVRTTQDQHNRFVESLNCSDRRFRCRGE